MMHWKSHIGTFLLGLFLSWLLFMQLMFWQMPFVGSMLGILYLGVLTYLWQHILHHVFRFERGFVSWFLSVFAAIFFVSALESIVLALYTTTPLLTASTLLGAFLLSYLLKMWFLQRPHGHPLQGKSIKESIPVFPKISWFTWVYLGIWGITVVLFFKADGTGVFFSPWQSLSLSILPLVFVLTAILGVLIFSRMGTKHVLMLILFHSLLLHLYIPLSHRLPWGGDVWRHMGVEEQLAAGEIVPPVLFGTEARWREVAGVDIPEAFLIPQKYSYGQFWSLGIITHQLTGISFKTIHIWMLPLIWSFVFPLLLFRIGRLVLNSWRGGLCVAWLSFLAFPLQALGALSLPVSFGVLTFLFTFMLLLQYLARPHSSQKLLLILLSVLLLFGYALSFLLFLFVVLGAWVFSQIGLHIKKGVWQWVWVFWVTLLGACAFPIIELAAHTSVFPSGISLFESTKTILGQFSGWYYASSIRPHDMLSGNLMFNHTPVYAFVSSIFTLWRWWLMPFMIGMWGIVLYAVMVFVREKKSFVSLLSAWLLVSLLGAYKIGWFVLAGDRTLIRRLDPYIATFTLLFVALGMVLLFSLIRYRSLILRRILAGVCIFIVAWASTSTYASGPDMRSTSTDEYAVATFLASELRGFSDDLCVLADTWVLLPLEAVTAGDIVGGNFSLDSQFGQHERVALYETFLNGDATNDTVTSMFTLTERSQCFVVLPDIVSEDLKEEISILLDVLPVVSPGFFVWHARVLPLNSAAL
ncbi:MAG: hypothetical protein UW10_C0022G0019 [Candidatus Magasanikbacteria bacterium GW2011_GWA2_43_9]|nr:MAG: hypothetical protein UW10_C0022G0019 [Candidatus Magasanikbacteria bacterium GW2011_GWA2_43_9]